MSGKSLTKPTAETLPDVFKRKSRNLEGRTPDSDLPEDYRAKDEILRIALAWSEKNVSYALLDQENHVDVSYAEDSLAGFKATVRKWLIALRRSGERS